MQLSGHCLLTQPLQGSPFRAASHFTLRARQGTHALLGFPGGLFSAVVALSILTNSCVVIADDEGAEFEQVLTARGELGDLLSFGFSAFRIRSEVNFIMPRPTITAVSRLLSLAFYIMEGVGR